MCLEIATSLAGILSRQSSAKGSEVVMCYFSHRVIISLASCPVCWHSGCRAGTPLLAASMAAAGACMARERHRGWRSESGTSVAAQDALGLAVLLTNLLSKAWTSPTAGFGQGLQESQVCTGAVCLCEALHWCVFCEIPMSGSFTAAALGLPGSAVVSPPVVLPSSSQKCAKKCMCRNRIRVMYLTWSNTAQVN